MMRAHVLVTIVGAVVFARPAAAQCLLCAESDAPANAAAARPLRIEVETMLDFSRAAQRGSGGSIEIDGRSGGRTVRGLIDLGGIAIKGVVRLTGEPLRRIRILLPAVARLTSPDGGTADVVDLTGDLSPDAALDGSGRLMFSFGGKLRVGPTVAGELRGRIPIVAEYQ